MARQTSDRAPAGLWRARLRDLLHDCAASVPAEQADRIREAHALLWLGDDDARFAIQGPDLPALDAMLSAGAYESAVVALIGSDRAFMLSRGANGKCLASLLLRDGKDELAAEASTLALALLCAHISSVLADEAIASAAVVRSGLGAALRLN